MTLNRWTFESQPNGTTVTVSNSDDFGDPAFSAVSRTGSAVLAYSNAHPAFGTIGVQVSAAAGEVALVRSPTFTSKQVATQLFIYVTAYPTTACDVIQFRNASGTNCTIQMDTSGRLRMYDDADVPISGMQTSALALNTLIEVDARVEVGTTTSNGKAYLEYRDKGAGTATESLSNTAVNAGTTDLASVQVGKPNSAGAIANLYIDAFGVQDGVTSFLSPPGANVPPTCSAGADQTVAAGATVTLSGTDSDSDGTISSRLWTCTSAPSGVTPSITSSTSATATVTLATAGHYTFQYEVTDNSGASTSDMMNVYVTTTASRPENQVSNTGSWTGAASTLSDESDGTYLESVDSPSSAATVFRLQPLSAGQKTIKVRYAASAASPTRSGLVELLNGPTGTAFASLALDDVTDTVKEKTYALTSGELAAITDLTNVHVRFTAS